MERRRDGEMRQLLATAKFREANHFKRGGGLLHFIMSSLGGGGMEGGMEGEIRGGVEGGMGEGMGGGVEGGMRWRNGEEWQEG